MRTRRASVGVMTSALQRVAAQTVAQTAVEPIAALIARIRDHYDPQQIWLFGSRARGDARTDSDWDLLVVVDDSTPSNLFAPETMWHLLDLGHVQADVVLLPSSEFLEDIDTPNTLAYPVAREGRLVYER